MSTTETGPRYGEEEIELPADFFKPEDEIKSKYDLDRAMRWLAFVEARDKRLDGNCKKLCDQVKADYQKLKAFIFRDETPPRTVTHADYVKKVTAKVIAYFKKNKQSICDAGKKSCKMTHGKLSYRDLPAAVTYAEGESSKSVSEFLDAKYKLVAALTECLESIEIVQDVSAADIVDVGIRVSLQKVNDLFDDGHLKALSIESWGLIEKKSETKFEVKPHAMTLQSEESSAA